MKLPRRTFLHLAAGAAALPAVSRLAWAQAYPSRQITMIVPFPPGASPKPIPAIAQMAKNANSRLRLMPTTSETPSAVAPSRDGHCARAFE